MKLIKINTDHYVVVDDTIQPVNEYYYDSFIKAIRNTSDAEYGKAIHCWQITHSTQAIEKEYMANEDGGHGYFIFNKIKELPLQEIRQLTGDVDKFEMFLDNEIELGLSNRDTIERIKWYYNSYFIEDNKEKKYTEEDLRKVFLSGVKWDTYKEDEPEYKMNMEEVFIKTIQSLQHKTEWDVEIVDGKLKLI